MNPRMMNGTCVAEKGKTQEQDFQAASTPPYVLF
jgi:hypothetical protein